MKSNHSSPRAIAFLLATLLAVSAGCADQAGSGPSSAASTGGAASDTAQEEPVEIRIFSSYSSSDESEASRFIVEEMEKACGVRLVRDEIPESAYQEKLQLALSDGN